jgi:hypothetical protein
MTDYKPVNDLETDDSEFPDIEAEFGGAGASVEYHCTEEELADAGFAGGFSVRALDDMPEHESEFVPATALIDPHACPDLPFARSSQELVEMVERWDWTGLPGLYRLARVLASDIRCEPFRVAP